jgi:4-amino-4-deoxy-L-arabinose transferase-like glycosyltransferase
MNLDILSDSKFLWRYAMILALVTYVVGMLVTVMEIDGAVYAEISREMYENGNWAELYLKGQDWLDKPHFQFWATAASFHLFGVSSFSYKLPAVFFMLLGVYYLFLFCRRFYSEQHGYIAVLFLATAQHIITSNSDVRAEPYLTGFTIISLYYLAVFLEDKKFYQLVAGSFFLALLLMTKGLYTIIPTASGIGLALIFERKWKQILHWQWLLAVVLTSIFILPSLYGYYIQFDLHPEKEVFGNTNISGIRFFFWDSQWGRFSNTGPIKGAGDPTFFLHTMLWAYMPWAFLAYFALYSKSKLLLAGKNKSESYTFFGFLFLFIVFCISSFQLPHYLNALFPFLSIVVADCLFRFARNKKFVDVSYHIHFWSGVLLLVAVIAIHILFSNSYPTPDTLVVFLIGIALVLMLYRNRSGRFKKLIFIPAIAVLSVNYYINRNFYPELLGYQSESEVAFYIQEHSLDNDQLISLGLREEMTSFLLKRIVPKIELESAGEDDLAKKLVFTNKEGIQRIESLGLAYDQLESFADFRITTLNGTFLNKNSREKELEIKYLLKVR